MIHIYRCNLMKMLFIPRWFKYEEDLDPDNGSWGKPHISQLSFLSLGNLRWVHLV